MNDRLSSGEPHLEIGIDRCRPRRHDLEHARLLGDVVALGFQDFAGRQHAHGAAVPVDDR